MKIKDQIKTRREQLGISVNELAKRVGVSAQSVRFWESGRSFPGKSKAPAVEAALSMSLDWTQGSRLAVDRPNMTALIDPADLDLLLQICRLPPPVKSLISQLVSVNLVAMDNGRQGFMEKEAARPIPAFRHMENERQAKPLGEAGIGKRSRSVSQSKKRSPTRGKAA